MWSMHGNVMHALVIDTTVISTIENSWKIGAYTLKKEADNTCAL